MDDGLDVVRSEEEVLELIMEEELVVDELWVDDELEVVRREEEVLELMNEEELVVDGLWVDDELNVVRSEEELVVDGLWVDDVLDVVRSEEEVVVVPLVACLLKKKFGKGTALEGAMAKATRPSMSVDLMLERLT